MQDRKEVPRAIARIDHRLPAVGAGRRLDLASFRLLPAAEEHVAAGRRKFGQGAMKCFAAPKPPTTPRSAVRWFRAARSALPGSAYLGHACRAGCCYRNPAGAQGCSSEPGIVWRSSPACTWSFRTHRAQPADDSIWVRLPKSVLGLDSIRSSWCCRWWAPTRARFDVRHLPC